MTKPIDDAMREQSAELRRQVNADRPTREDLRKLRAQMKGDPSTSIRYLAAPMLLERLEAALAERDAARAAGFAEAIETAASHFERTAPALGYVPHEIRALSPAGLVVVPKEVLWSVHAALKAWSEYAELNGLGTHDTSRALAALEGLLTAGGEVATGGKL